MKPQKPQGIFHATIFSSFLKAFDVEHFGVRFDWILQKVVFGAMAEVDRPPLTGIIRWDAVLRAKK